MKTALSINLTLLTLFLFSCSDKDVELENEVAIDTTEMTSFPLDESQKDDSVQIQLKIDKIDQLTFNLVLDLKLFGGTWIVSPLAYDYPYGHLRIDLDEKNHLTKVDSLLEEPKSKKFYDESYEGSYALIKEKVTLTQKLKITDKSDFKVHGLIFFVLEPICSIFEVSFIINHQNGELSLDQM